MKATTVNQDNNTKFYFYKSYYFQQSCSGSSPIWALLLWDNKSYLSEKREDTLFCNDKVLNERKRKRRNSIKAKWNIK